MDSPFKYVQLQTQDREKAKTFYKELFGWTLDERQTPVGPYVEVFSGQDKIAGIVAHPDSSAPSSWVPYINVTDMKPVVERARTLGATVVQGPTQLPDKSWFSLIIDSAGAKFGLHQSTA